jgi:hypothetical protein
MMRKGCQMMGAGCAFMGMGLLILLALGFLAFL